MACYLFLAVYALLLCRQQTWDSCQRCPARILILAGYLAGAAVATKYPAVLFVLLPPGRLGSSVGRLGATNPISRPLPLVTVFLLAAAVGCGLWFGKNWVQSGNPTYPLLYEVFDGKTWNAEKDRQWNRVHRPDDFSAETLGKDWGAWS